MIQMDSENIMAAKTALLMVLKYANCIPLQKSKDQLVVMDITVNWIRCWGSSSETLGIVHDPFIAIIP